jgi:ATP-dependent protease ClpP protease subunit
MKLRRLKVKDLKSSLIDLKAIQLQYAFEHGVNFGQRIITISNDIDHDTFRLIDAALTEMEAESKARVIVRINSCGGGVYDALAIVGRLKASKCTIVTEAYGAVMSAAIAILVAGDKRKMSSEAWAMWHSAIYEASGTHREVKALVEQREKEELQWSLLMGKHTLRDSDYWYKKAMEPDFYLNADQALELGVIDDII